MQRMTRRQVVQGMSAVGLALGVRCGQWPWQAQRATAPRIGYLAYGSSEFSPRDEAFRQALRDRGYAEGENVAIEWRFTEGNDQVRDFAAELVRLRPAVVVAAASPAVSAAQQATKEIPIVMPLSGDPVRQGYATSLARPGGNITGLTTTSSSPISGKRLQLLKEVALRAGRVAVLWNPANPAKLLDLQETEGAARTLGVQLEAWEVRGGDDFEGAFAAISRQRPDALVLLPDLLTLTYRAQIADFAVQSGLPSISELREFAEAGGLMTYGPDLSDLYRRAAGYVDRILKGTKPADLPIEQPTKFDLVINLRTAQALGLTIPQHVLLQATEVIQ